jgi:signal transduction histidine kinase
MISGLVGASELLEDDYSAKLIKIVHQAIMRLKDEIAIQKCISENERYNYQPVRLPLNPEQIFSELKGFFSNHPVVATKTIEYQENLPNVIVKTDLSLISRILFNMIINACEATTENGTVKIFIEHDNDILSFCVWNAQEIPADVVSRIFQRNYSTKQQSGRGFGTFSMKFFGENVLGGRISFQTSHLHGTVFRFSLPVDLQS